MPGGLKAAPLLIVLGLGGFALASTPVRADDAGDEEYRTLITEAVSEFSAGHWAEAYASFERAHELNANARTHRGLGMSAFELRRYVEAQRGLEASLVDTRHALTDEQRAQVQELLERTRRYVGSVQVELSVPGAELHIDGTPASDHRPWRWDATQQLHVPVSEGRYVLDIGEHNLSASAPGHHPAQATVAVNGGETAQIKLELSPVGAAPAPAPASAPGPVAAIRPSDVDDSGGVLSQWWFWTAVGVGAAAAVAVVLVVGSDPEPKDYVEGDVGGVVFALESVD